MDLTALTDSDLDALRVDVLNEQDRRRGDLPLTSRLRHT